MTDLQPMNINTLSFHRSQLVLDNWFVRFYQYLFKSCEVKYEQLVCR